jgi:hypothetical protein
LDVTHREQPVRLMVNGQALVGYAPILIYA